MSNAVPIDESWYVVMKQDYHLTFGDGPHISTDNNGTKYVTLVAGGIKPEGKAFPIWCTSQNIALNFYNKALLEWLKNRQIIIWRSRPEILISEFKSKKIDGRASLYQVWSRLSAY